MHTISSAAKLLKLSRVWVYELINRGELATSTVGGLRFVVEDERFKALRRTRAKSSDAKRRRPA